MDLPSVLGGLAQGFKDFGTSVVDLFGTGGANVADIIESIRTGKATTRNQDDFRKWLYNTDSVKDAAAKGLGTALNGVQTVSDYLPGISALTRSPLGNAAQGALGGLADEFKMAGENYDLGRAGQRAAVSGAAALAGSSLSDALKKSANPLLRSGLSQGLARGAAGGAINQGGYAAIDGGDIMQGALQGAGLGALIGGATGAVQDFIPRKRATLSVPVDEEIEVMAEYDPLESTLSRQDMAVNASMEPEAAVIAGKPRTWDELYGMLSSDAGAYENESRAPITATAKQLQNEIQAINAQYPDDMPDDVWSKRFDLNQQLKALESGYNTPYDYYVGESKRRFREDFESRPDRYKSKIADLEKQIQAQASLEQDIANASPRKLAQFEIIQKKNPAPNDTLTWIRSPKDIMTWDETIAAKQAGEDVGFSWPDYSFEDALRDQKRGKMTVYSSYPVKGGTFVTPSYQQASYYAGGGRVYSKVIKPKDVAWINGDEGQYAYTKVKSLESTLANADMAVNSAKIAPGQLGLFDDLPTQTPKTGTRQTSLFDQPQEGLDYYGSDVETPVIEPTNPYAPVNGQITQEMQDRAAEVLKNYKKGIPENELYDAINPDTLPAVIKGAKTLDMAGLKSMTKDIFGVDDIKKADLGKVIQYAFSDEPGLARYYMDYAQNESPKSSLYKRVQKSAVEAANKKMTGEMVKQLLDSETIGSDNLLEIKRYTPSDHAIRSGYTAAADEVLSERLGIAPGNTPKYNGPMDTRKAYGRYSHPVYGSGGDLAIFERKMDSPEDAVSTIAHERLHSFQGESESRNLKNNRYSKEVTDAYNELHNALKDHYKTWEETANRYGTGHTSYWQRANEQEARMLQNYLENKGYAKAPQMADKYRAGEWGDEINPAFDKFFDKLRDLSKRGVALPALATLFGGGALLATQNNDKEKEVK